MNHHVGIRYNIMNGHAEIRYNITNDCVGIKFMSDLPTLHV